MNPFFSVVIPTYNRAELLRECISSVLGQVFVDYEIIVVDDESTDHTAEVVNSFASTKIRYYKKKNAERGAARNFGIGKSKGKYVSFLDSDDKMEPNHFTVLFSHLESKQEDFIASKYRSFGSKSSTIPKDIYLLKQGYHTYQTFLIGNPLACCFTVRRENPTLISFNEELKFTIMEDWIFLIQNLRNSEIYLIDAYTMAMRDHADRSMRLNNQRIILARLNATEFLQKELILSEYDRGVLIGNSHYFCAVHYYIEGQMSQAFQNLFQSIGFIGLSKNTIFLFLKCLIKPIWKRN